MRLLIPWLAILPLGCSGSPEADESRYGSETALMSDEQRREEIERRSSVRPGVESRLAEPVAEPSAKATTGEVPATLLDDMKRDLAARLSAGRANISVVVAESITWNDGSLGCPKPGEVYTQATVPGYRVVLELAGQRYAYHADSGGHFVACGIDFGWPPAGTNPDR